MSDWPMGMDPRDPDWPFTAKTPQAAVEKARRFVEACVTSPMKFSDDYVMWSVGPVDGKAITLTFGDLRMLVDQASVDAQLAGLMETAPRIDPTAVPPSLETLLAGTEFAAALPPTVVRMEPMRIPRAALDRLRELLRGRP